MRNNLRFKNLIPFILFLTLLFGLFDRSNADVVPDELQKQINEKTKALEDINQKISQAQKSLDETSVKGKTLSQEIKKIDGNISQLNLGIRSSEINITKTSLEIDALQYDISDKEKQINLNKNAVSTLLRELQRKDEETMLVSFLKNKSLTENLDEATAIVNINSGLSNEVTKLTQLNNELSAKLSNVSDKKQDLELENKNFKNRKSIVESQKSDKRVILVQTKNQEKSYQQLLANLQKEQEAIENEISVMEEKLRLSFDPNLLPVQRSGVVAWPIKLISDGGIGYITQVYGAISKLYKSGKHNGLDIGAPIGTPVFAADDGRVSAVDNNDRNSWSKYQYGKYILIEHQNNLTTLYSHLSIQLVSKNTVVKRGDLIGYSGNTGFSTGPHLHFGVYWTPSISMKAVPPAQGLVPIGVTINPEGYL
ncbi:MAG: peptidase M23b [Parcubacteria group bacterium Athens0714_26]|nr:MAG: peptidase M23b [Parcubacteria group bacterium Athens1014_26]TSD03294.1 MAG: peptidase M23b [Parcubacteria group bacterium Athens0714_26]